MSRDHSSDPAAIVAPRLPKTGRSRYVRLFPERNLFLFDQLDAKEHFAYLKLLTAYVIRDGVVPDDPKQIAKVCGITRKSWASLRAKLIDLGLGRVEEGRWVDDDQDRSLELQRRYSEKQRQRVRARWPLKVVEGEP